MTQSKEKKKKIKQLLSNFPASILESCYQLRFVFVQGVSNFWINRIKKALAECVLQETQ